MSILDILLMVAVISIWSILVINLLLTLAGLYLVSAPCEARRTKTS